MTRLLRVEDLARVGEAHTKPSRPLPPPDKIESEIRGQTRSEKRLRVRRDQRDGSAVRLHDSLGSARRAPVQPARPGDGGSKIRDAISAGTRALSLTMIHGWRVSLALAFVPI